MTSEVFVSVLVYLSVLVHDVLVGAFSPVTACRWAHWMLELEVGDVTLYHGSVKVC